MALQDLTPQLRTRLSRVERAVGLFVTIATILLLVGFAYYIYHTAQRKGWFVPKVKYSTSLNDAIGLKVGDPVRLMGFVVGEITKIEANKPSDWFNVTVDFEIRRPYYGYIWTDSHVRVASELLGTRYLEVVKGRAGLPTIVEKEEKVTAILDRKLFESAVATQAAVELQNSTNTPTMATNKAVWFVIGKATTTPASVYQSYDKSSMYWVAPLESPAMAERLDQVAVMVQNAIPSVLNLTNQLAAVLTNVTSATTKLDGILAQAKPLLTNLDVITSNLRDPNGSLGNWLIPTALNSNLNGTLSNANKTLVTADHFLSSTDTNLTVVVMGLDDTLVNLANLTSNLSAQVQANTNLVKNVSDLLLNTDDLVQGLKRHWLLRGAFKTNTPPVKPRREPVLLTPKMRK
jgi:ABC-type transporter Mla subunit MlaD